MRKILIAAIGVVALLASFGLGIKVSQDRGGSGSKERLGLMLEHGKIRFPFALTPDSSFGSVQSLAVDPEKDCYAAEDPLDSSECVLTRGNLQLEAGSFTSKRVLVQFVSDMYGERRLESLLFQGRSKNCGDAKVQFGDVDQSVKDLLGNRFLEKRMGLPEHWSCSSSEGLEVEYSDGLWRAAVSLMPGFEGDYLVGLSISYLPHEEIGLNWLECRMKSGRNAWREKCAFLERKGDVAPVRFPFSLTPESTVADVQRLRKPPVDVCFEETPRFLGPVCELRHAEHQLVFGSFRSDYASVEFVRDIREVPVISQVSFRQDLASCRGAWSAFDSASRLTADRFGEALRERRSGEGTREGHCIRGQGPRLRKFNDFWEVEVSMVTIDPSRHSVSLSISYRPHENMSRTAQNYFRQIIRQEALERL